MSGCVVDLRRVYAVIDGKTVLKNITWKVMKGESWSVIGPNGSGKTTLLSIVNGYRWPSKGEASIFGRRFGELDLREMRKDVGFVSSYLSGRLDVNDKVRDVVISGRHGSTRVWSTVSREEEKYSDSLLRLMGCFECRNKRITELSEGERQRIMIARALMPRPKLLVLDEPCEGLDLQTREKLISLLSKLARRRSPTIINVTHRTEEIPENFTHAMLLRDGERVASGPIGRIITDRNMSRCFNVGVKIKRVGHRYYTLL